MLIQEKIDYKEIIVKLRDDLANTIYKEKTVDIALKDINQYKEYLMDTMTVKAKKYIDESIDLSDKYYKKVVNG